MLLSAFFSGAVLTFPASLWVDGVSFAQAEGWSEGSRGDRRMLVFAGRISVLFELLPPQQWSLLLVISLCFPGCCLMAAPSCV